MLLTHAKNADLHVVFEGLRDPVFGHNCQKSRFEHGAFRCAAQDATDDQT